MTDDHDGSSRRQRIVEEEERTNARCEADEILALLRADQCDLDAFHLLGVVTDPRVLSEESNTTSALFNAMLDDLYSQIVPGGGDEPTTTNTTEPAGIPLELTTINVTSIESYLQRTGKVAASFAEILQTAAENGGNYMSKKTTTVMTTTTMGNSELENTSMPVPDVFFSNDFDLTDPATFQRILLIDDERATTASTTTTTTTTDDGPVSVWLGLKSPDLLNTHLDWIETNLLRQVRSNSSNFLEESQRFADLQYHIQSLLDTVLLQSNTVEQLYEHYLPAKTNITKSDTERNMLHQLDDVLQIVEDLYVCKHGLGGVLAAASGSGSGDHHDMTASIVLQIQYVHNLLTQVPYLHAVQPIHDHLVKYEQLVIQNLRDELLELFLLSTSSSSSISSSHTNNGRVSSGGGSGSGGWDTNRANELLNGLQQLDALNTVATAYSSRIQDTIRMTVRTVVAEFSSTTESSSTTTTTTVLVATVPTTHPSVASGVNSMSTTRFLDCLDLLLEQIMELLVTIQRVDAFFGTEFPPEQQQQDPAEPSNGPSLIASVLMAAVELTSKSISELLRVRKEAHSLLTLDEMKQVWGRCTAFCEQVETILHNSSSSSSSHGTTAAPPSSSSSSVFANLRSTLLAQSKAFLERRHETNMAGLAAALDSERWVQCEVSAERQEAMTRLSTGRTMLLLPVAAVVPKRNSTNGESSTSAAAAAISTTTTTTTTTKASEMEVNGYGYKVVWSCLLLLEMVSSNLATSAFFPNLATSSVAKISELLRLFNSRTTQLVLGAGAMHSHAKLKSINAKHLSLVTQCLGLVMELLPHVRGTLLAQLPNKQQHTLLATLDQVRIEYGEHNEKVLNKLVSIIGGLVERGLAKRIPGTDFDERAKLVETTTTTTTTSLTCCAFLDEVASHTRRMHQVIRALLHPDHLIDTFSKIFALLDTKVPALIIAAAVERQQVFQRQDTNRSPTSTTPAAARVLFSFPRTDAGKRRLLMEVFELTKLLNALEGVRPWEFTAVQILEKALEYSLHNETEAPSLAGSEDTAYGSSSDGERSEAPVDSGTDDNTVENGRSSREANGHTASEGMASTEKEDVVVVDSDSGDTVEEVIPASSGSIVAHGDEDVNGGCKEDP
jgi:vacuolar protein sorting-associated protein 54